VAVSIFSLSDKKTLLNTNVFQFMKSPFTKQEQDNIREAINKTGIWADEAEFTASDGSLFWGNIVIKLFHSGENALQLVRIANIQEKKQYEQALIAAKEKAEEMNRLKSGFLANISHEIRTPLNGILGLAEVIGVDSQDPETLQYTKLIKESGTRLLDTINNILDASKIEANKQSTYLEPCDMNVIVEQSARLLKVLAVSKGLQYELNLCRYDLPIVADRIQLEQVVNNFISNAIKFTDQGSIRITTSIIKGNNGMLHAQCSVADTGIGIPPDRKHQLFTPFLQLSDGLGKKYQGTGLGLSICKSYISAMEGEIRVESEPGKGSVFSVLLPLRETQEEASKA
jgi:signal transduction histidine kinase